MLYSSSYIHILRNPATSHSFSCYLPILSHQLFKPKWFSSELVSLLLPFLLESVLSKANKIILLKYESDQVIHLLKILPWLLSHSGHNDLKGLEDVSNPTSTHLEVPIYFYSHPQASPSGMLPFFLFLKHTRYEYFRAFACAVPSVWNPSPRCSSSPQVLLKCHFLCEAFLANLAKIAISPHITFPMPSLTIKFQTGTMWNWKGTLLIIMLSREL